MGDLPSHVEEASDQKTHGLSEQCLYDYITKSQSEIYPSGAVEWIMQRDSSDYARLFYFLSINNNTVNARSFKTSFLHRNFKNFTESELAYICEGVKLQLERGALDFYYISHHFFEEIDKSPQLRNLLLFLMNGGGYRVRELLLTHELIEKIINLDTSDAEKRVFVARFIKQLISMDNGAIKSYLDDSGLTITVQSQDGCLRFFPKWLERHGREYGGIVATIKSLENGNPGQSYDAAL